MPLDKLEHSIPVFPDYFGAAKRAGMTDEEERIGAIIQSLINQSPNLKKLIDSAPVRMIFEATDGVVENFYMDVPEKIGDDYVESEERLNQRLQRDIQTRDMASIIDALSF